MSMKHFNFIFRPHFERNRKFRSTISYIITDPSGWFTPDVDHTKFIVRVDEMEAAYTSETSVKLSISAGCKCRREGSTSTSCILSMWSCEFLRVII
jgi:hypothetical protein